MTDDVPTPHTQADITRCVLIPAMVTPFNNNGQIDEVAFSSLTQYLIHQQHCDALLVNGTTGESPTTTFEEKQTLLRLAKQSAAPNIPVITGCGGNNTTESIEQAKIMTQEGADALLCVVPYYNKPSQNGMVAHFTAIAQAVPHTPIMLYNIPGRTGVLMQPETMHTLHSTCPNIIGVKQSHPDMDAVSHIRRLLPPSFHIWSGDDPLILPMMSCGAQGVVSVLAHLLGKPLFDMITAYTNGNLARAQTLHQHLAPIGQALFTLPNPTIVKSALAHQGHLQPIFRLPMLPPTPEEDHLVNHVLHAIEAFESKVATI